MITINRTNFLSRNHRKFQKAYLRENILSKVADKGIRKFCKNLYWNYLKLFR